MVGRQLERKKHHQRHKSSLLTLTKWHLIIELNKLLSLKFKHLQNYLILQVSKELCLYLNQQHPYLIQDRCLCHRCRCLPCLICKVVNLQLACPNLLSLIHRLCQRHLCLINLNHNQKLLLILIKLWQI